MAKKETVQPLTKLLQEMLNYKVDDLVSRTDWGSINFENAREDLGSRA